MLVSILYAIFLEPLESLYRLVFDICQKISGHHLLVALLMLSVISSLVLAAVERKAAKYVNQEKLIQGILAKQIAAIKGQFSGLKRQQEIKYLYQRYSYNPLYSARASLGVLAQLPFLLGAYLMLLHDEELAGVSVPGIADLSKPDALLFGLNLLPCLMLAVNALNSFMSTWLTRKEKLTALTIGMVFFVLLYAAPSCLLIYWTTNNVIQLLRTLRRRLGGTRKTFGVGLKKKIAVIAGKPSLPAGNEDSVIIAPRTVGYCMLSLIGLTCVWLVGRGGAIVSNYCNLDPGNARDPNCIASLPRKIYELSGFATLFSCIFGIALLALLYVILKPMLKELKHHGLKHVFTTCGRCTGISLVMGMATGTMILCCSMSMSGQIGIIALGLTLLTLIVSCLPERHRVISYLMPDADVLNKSKALFMPAALIITGLAIVYAPTMLFLSDPRSFGIGFWDLITDNLKFLWFLWFTLGFGYYIATGRIRVIATFIMVTAAIIALIYEFLVVLKVGNIQAFIIDSGAFVINDDLCREQDLSILLITVVGLLAVYRLKKLRLISTIFYVFCAYIYLGPCVEYQQHKDAIAIVTASFSNNSLASSNNEAPDNVKDFFKFSQQDNVLVIALDAFTGGNMREIIAKHPELKNDLEGFTWYEDTMTAGQSTVRGMQVCIGGELVDPVRMQHDNGMSTAERINKGWAEFLNYLAAKGYQSNVHEPMWLRPDLIGSHLQNEAKNTKFLNDYNWNEGFWDPQTQVQYFSELKDIDLPNRDAYVDIHKFSRMYGLYTILPNFKKYKVYKYGRWGNSVEIYDYVKFVKVLEYSNSELMPQMATAQLSHPQYKFIHLAMTHYPYNMDEKCNFNLNKFFNNINHDGTIDGHLNVEYCQLKSLGKFFKWMKEQGIYDKSQIIITSDHGEHVITQSVDDSRLHALGIGVENPQYFACKNASYALLLVKERNSDHELCINSEYLMSNMDIPLLIKHAFGDVLDEAPYLDKNRVRINVQAGMSTPNEESNSGAFVVRGSMFDKSHWTEVIDQQEVQELWKLLYDHE